MFDINKEDHKLLKEIVTLYHQVVTEDEQSFAPRVKDVDKQLDELAVKLYKMGSSKAIAIVMAFEDVTGNHLFPELILYHLCKYLFELLSDKSDTDTKFSLGNRIAN